MIRTILHRSAVVLVAGVMVAAATACGSDADTTTTTTTTVARPTADPPVVGTTDTGVGPGVVDGIGPEELGDGVVLDVWLAADGGVFDPDLDTVFTVVFDVEGLGSDAILEVQYELDLLLTTIRGDTSVLLRPDDEPEASRVIVNRNVGAADLGAYTLTYQGTVTARDGSFEFPVERVVRFVATEEGPAPIETIDLVGGALTVEASRRWAVTSPLGSFTRQLERARPDGPVGLDLADTQVLVDLVARDLRTVTVRRSLTPLVLDDLAVLAANIPEVFGAGQYADPVPVEIGGLSGLRTVRTHGDVTTTIDLLEARDEVFIVQASHRDDPDRADEVADEVAAVRDSLRFHPDEFVRLTHAVEHGIWLTVDDERFFQIDTSLPADWQVDAESPGLIISPEGPRRLVRQSFPAGDRTLEQFVEQLLGENVPDGAEGVSEPGERGGLEAATITIMGDPAGDASIVVLTDGVTFEVTTVRDDPDDPDPGLLAAITASVRPVGPPSTN